jgi:hypothetical protein
VLIREGREGEKRQMKGIRPAVLPKIRAAERGFRTFEILPFD